MQAHFDIYEDSDAYRFHIMVSCNDMVVGQINFEYDSLDDEDSPLSDLSNNIKNNIDVRDQFIYEFYSHESKIYNYIGYSYVGNILSFFEIRVDDFRKKNNYSDDNIVCKIQIAIDNTSKERQVLNELKSFEGNYRIMYKNWQKKLNEY